MCLWRCTHRPVRLVALQSTPVAKCSREFLLSRVSVWPSKPNLGSLGWAQRFWCWKWEYDMYIVDWIQNPICGACIERLCQGKGPPWWPDSRTRLEIVLMRRLPANPARLIAEYAREDWEP